MIIEKIELRNFGLFAGDHSIDLRPKGQNGKSQPIILFGGLNGGGKTTLFDAILLTLYGPRARCSKRGSMAYEDFLAQCVHRGTDPAEGASLSVSFQYHADGEKHLYEVRRAWSKDGERVREFLEVLRDGVLDRVRTENWNNLVEDLIPSGLAQLFFFDGDRIRSLAEDESYSEVLGSAIKSLLGLDLVERLVSDVEVVGRRQKGESLSEGDQRRLTELETENERLTIVLRDKKDELASCSNDLGQAEKRRGEAEEAFAAGGGRHHEKREALKIRLAQSRTQETERVAQLRDMAGGALPLVLVESLLGTVQARNEKAADKHGNDLVLKVLSERDKRVLETAKRSGANQKVLAALRIHLERDRKTRKAKGKDDSLEPLSPRAAATLKELLGGGIAKLRKSSRDLVRKVSRSLQDVEDTERALGLTPDEALVAALGKKLQEADRYHAVVKDRVERLEGEILELKRKVEHTQGQLCRLLETKATARSASADAERRAELARRTVGTMQVFLRKATSRKIERLAHHISESFRFLLRKRGMVERIAIDPQEFTIEIIGRNGKVVPRNRLSEGEKQLFAVSVLWGLAKSSARPLPAIIDTPMARLDSEHRSNLVERYFPHASHQVIVLSTDTEVDRRYYQSLQAHVARAYRLDYSEEEQLTTVRDGYFWKD